MMISICNVDRIKNIKEIYGLLVKNMPKGTTVTLKINEPVPDMSYIEITGDVIAFKYGEYVIKTVSNADNMEIYPLVDGRIRMNIGFYNTTTEVK